MSRRQTQKDKVLAHLKQHGMITPLDALKMYGAFRLGAIIHTLRHEEGYNIKTDIAKGDANYAIYSLTNNPCNIDDEDLEADVNKMYEEHMSYDYETQYDKVPETIDMFDNPNTENVIEKVKAKIESNKKLTDAQLIANEVNLIKEHGFMDYLKGTMYSKKGGKDGSKG